MDTKRDLCDKFFEECDQKCGYNNHVSKEAGEDNVCLSCEG